MNRETETDKIENYLEIITPVPPRREGQWQLAQRPAELTGVRIGFLSNGKPNVGTLMQNLIMLHKERIGVKDTVYRTKPGVGGPAPGNILHEFSGCGVVINGVGD